MHVWMTCAAALLALAPGAFAQAPPDPESPSPEEDDEVSDLRERVRALEDEVDRMRGGGAGEEATEIPLDLETSIRGLGHVGFGLDEHTPPSFLVGDLVLSFRANLDRWLTFRSDVVYVSVSEGTIPIDLERIHASAAAGPGRTLTVGRFPMPLSYWATTALHGSFLYLPTFKPHVLIDYEAPIPTHQIGVSWEHVAPAGYWQVGYGAWVSNGRGPFLLSAPLAGDAGPGKAAGARLFVESPGGVRVQVGGYGDLIDPADADHAEAPADGDEHNPAVAEALVELIGAVNVVYDGPVVKVQAEGYLVSHIPEHEDEETAVSPQGYVLLGVRIGKVTPYAMGDYVQYPDHDVLYRTLDTNLEERRGSLGVRYDLALRAALKLQGSVVQHVERHGAATGTGTEPPADGHGDEEAPLGAGAHLQLAVGF